MKLALSNHETKDYDKLFRLNCLQVGVCTSVLPDSYALHTTGTSICHHLNLIETVSWQSTCTVGLFGDGILMTNSSSRIALLHINLNIRFI